VAVRRAGFRKAVSIRLEDGGPDIDVLYTRGAGGGDSGGKGKKCRFSSRVCLWKLLQGTLQH
jgi:hypothetical protein